MQLAIALTEFAYAKDHTAESRRWYKGRLGAFMDWAAAEGTTKVEDLTPSLIRRYIEHRRTTLSAATGKPLDSHTLQGHARAIRALLNWAASEDLLDEKVAKRVALPKREQKVLPILSPQQVDRLLRACDASETPARDKVILAGPPRHRHTRIRTLWPHLGGRDLHPDDAYVLVHGKGRKQREVPLGRTSRRLLHAYLYRGGRTLTVGQQSSRVFLGKGGAGLLPNGLDQLLYRLERRAGAQGFVGVRVSTHTFRHTYAVRSLEAGVDIYTLSRLMGHSTVSTTEGYLKAFTSRAARRAAVSILDQVR
jgi:site-specific recombinase XerD